jgi:hypothetical protein
VVQLLAAPALARGPNQPVMHLKPKAVFLGVNYPVLDGDSSPASSVEAKTVELRFYPPSPKYLIVLEITLYLKIQVCFLM